MNRYYGDLATDCVTRSLSRRDLGTAVTRPLEKCKYQQLSSASFVPSTNKQTRAIQHNFNESFEQFGWNEVNILPGKCLEISSATERVTKALITRLI
jgi:hypothetical protein